MHDPTDADVRPPTPDTEPRSRRRWRSLAERRADAAVARATEQRTIDQARKDRLEARRDHLAIEAEIAEYAQARADVAAKQRRTVRERISLAAVLASSNVGVNVAAVLGQVLALHFGQDWEWWQALPLALVVESVAVNVGYFAHDKMIKGYSAVGLRALSYIIGCSVGWFSYTHNQPLPETGDFAGVFGACSLLSPVLWQIYSKWRHWETMRSQGLLEERALHFPWLRWVIPSLSGETWAAFKHGIAEGLRSPDVALAEVRAGNLTRNAEQAMRAAREALIWTQGDALRLALAQLAALHHDLDGEDPAATEARQNIAQFVQRFHPFVPPLQLAGPVGGEDDQPEPAKEPGGERGKPTDQQNQRAKQYVIRTVKRSKTVPTKSAVASKFGFSESWGYDRVLDAKRELEADGWAFDVKGNPVEPGGTPPRSSNGSTPAGTAVAP